MSEERVCSTPVKRGGYVASLQGAAQHNILPLDVEITFASHRLSEPPHVHSFYLPRTTITTTTTNLSLFIQPTNTENYSPLPNEKKPKTKTLVL